MTHTIYKYSIPDSGRSECVQLSLPAGAQILSFGLQPSRSSDFQIWALVDPSAKEEPRQFAILGTGTPISGMDPRKLKLIDRFISDSWVFHLFEIVPLT